LKRYYCQERPGTDCRWGAAAHRRALCHRGRSAAEVPRPVAASAKARARRSPRPLKTWLETQLSRLPASRRWLGRSA